MKILELDGQYADSMDFKVFCSVYNFLINCNINHLILDTFNEAFDENTLTRCIKLFPKLTSLTLSEVSNPINVDTIKKHCPNIIKLSFINDYIPISVICVKQFIHCYGCNLKYLKFSHNKYSQYNYELSRVNFNKLEFFETSRINLQSLKNIINTTKNLRYFSICTKKVKCEPLKNILQKVIMMNKLLNEIEFRCSQGSNYGIKSVLIGIKRGLMSIDNRSANIVIRIHTTFSNTHTAYLFITNIKLFIIFLKYSYIENFAFVWHERNQNINMKLLLKILNKSLNDVVITIENKFFILIKNNDCKINAHFKE